MVYVKVVEMKQIINKTIIIFLFIGLLFSCHKEEKNNDENIKIVTTIFPIYDWVNNIVKDVDNIDVTILLDKGVDLHNYQLSADDMIEISSCDLFIYVGGESDEWVDDALKEAVNKNMKTLNLMELLSSSLKIEEEIEGMQEEEHDHELEEEYDEHIWLSLNNASKIINIIKDTMIEIDNDNKDKYQNNFEKYNNELEELNNKYLELNKSINNTVIFADRFPFRYLFDDYGINYYAAFKGCSAETEASFETIIFLANKLDEYQLDKIVILENSLDRIAKTVIENSSIKDCNIEIMNSIQSSTIEDYKAGKTYIHYMEDNLEVLKRILK